MYILAYQDKYKNLVGGVFRFYHYYGSGLIAVVATGFYFAKEKFMLEITFVPL